MDKKYTREDVSEIIVFTVIGVFLLVVFVSIVTTTVYNTGWYDGKKAGRAEYRELNTPRNFFGHGS